MTLDWIATATSEEPPAGPDLWENDDSVFSEYYFDAAGRLPEPEDYAKLGLEMGDGGKVPDVIFDPKSVDLKSELSQIDSLLQRSRDLRLLTLRAQWCMLAGEIEEVAISVSAMASLLEAMPGEAHPAIDGSTRDRLEAINDLTAMGAMILPLRYLDIGATGTSRRRVMVARSEASPHDGEDDLNLDAMFSALTNAKEEVAETHKSLLDFRDALTRIEAACLSNDTPHTPQLKPLHNELDAILAIIGQADPGLSPSTPESEDKVSLAEESKVVTNTAIVTEVKDHDEARQRLTAVETYFGKHEPSSAAVLLVTQSRLLIGKSLVDAFDILMPESAPRAKVDFISDNGFQLAHGQLRALADEVRIEDVSPPAPTSAPETIPTSAPGEGGDIDGENASEGSHGQHSTEQTSPISPVSTQVFVVTDAAQATAQISAVETYFRAVEKSSPIPMLLARARSYIGKDFETLLKEFVPKIDF